MLRLVALGFLAVGSLACRGGQPNVEPLPGAERIDPRSLQIEVENRNFNDATVYAVSAGHRQRLGRVTGKTTETFTFRWHNTELRMLVDFTGGGRLVSSAFAVTPGQDDDLFLIIGSRRQLWTGRRR